MTDDLTLLGRAEPVDFLDLNCKAVPSRIDTGAKTSALWASSFRVSDGALHVVLFGDGSPFYTGKEVLFEDYTNVAVASSTGEVNTRYKVKLRIVLSGRRIAASFTLADRSAQAYPVLIGRNVLRGKFIVDVAQGTVDRDAERQRERVLRRAVGKLDEEIDT